MDIYIARLNDKRAFEAARRGEGIWSDMPGMISFLLLICWLPVFSDGNWIWWIIAILDSLWFFGNLGYVIVEWYQNRRLRHLIKSGRVIAVHDNVESAIDEALQEHGLYLMLDTTVLSPYFEIIQQVQLYQPAKGSAAETKELYEHFLRQQAGAIAKGLLSQKLSVEFEAAAKEALLRQRLKASLEPDDLR